jgi:hypothetical protein
MENSSALRTNQVKSKIFFMSKPDQDFKLLPKPDPKSYLDAKKIMPDQQYCMNEQNTDISTSGIVLGLIHAYSKRLTEVSSNRKYLYIIKKTDQGRREFILMFSWPEPGRMRRNFSLRSLYARNALAKTPLMYTPGPWGHPRFFLNS